MGGEDTKQPQQLLTSVIEEIETPQSREMAKEAVKEGVDPIIAANRWAYIGMPAFTASYVRLAQLELWQKMNLLIEAFLHQADKLIQLGHKEKAQEAQNYAWKLLAGKPDTNPQQHI